MTKWMFRLRGQPYVTNGFNFVDYSARSVRAGRANGRTVIEVMHPEYEKPQAVLEPDAVFGFLFRPGPVVRVWPRDSTAASGEWAFVDMPPANFVEKGNLGDIDTWDLLNQKADPVGPIGRILLRWVSEHQAIG